MRIIAIEEREKERTKAKIERKRANQRKARKM